MLQKIMKHYQTASFLHHPRKQSIFSQVKASNLVLLWTKTYFRAKCFVSKPLRMVNATELPSGPLKFPLKGQTIK